LRTHACASDDCVRLDTKSGQITEYQMPGSANIRRVRTTDQYHSLVNSNHGAAIVMIEPLD
jgi:hypothetical protein